MATSLKLLYRDVDRTPYLFLLRECALQYGLELDVAAGGYTPDGWQDLLLQGGADVLAEGYWTLQELAAKGAPLVTVTCSGSYDGLLLLARSGVDSLVELRETELMNAIFGGEYAPFAEPRPA